MVINSHPLYQLSYRGIWAYEAAPIYGRTPAVSTVPAPPLIRLQQVPWAVLGALLDPLLATLAQVLGGSPAERALDRLLRSLAPTSGEQRRALAEAVFGVALWRRRLAHHAGFDRWEDAPPSLLLFALLRDLAGLSAGDAAALTRTRRDALPPARPPPEHPAVAHSLPDALWVDLERSLGEQAAPFAAAINLPGPVFLRANLLRTTRSALQARLSAEGIPTSLTEYSPLGLRVLAPRPNILGLPAHQEGLFEVQDEGSQLLGLLLGTAPGESVLDFCAGAGGKTLLLGAELQDQGTLHAFDVDLSRLDRLDVRARRAGLRNLRIHRSPLPADLQVGAVLVDAPCSELGVLRRGPDVRWRLDWAKIARLPALQLELLTRASAHVRPGGRLLYATCTVRMEENERVAQAFAQAQQDFEPIPLALAGLPADLFPGGFFRALPHLHGTDAFFAAGFRRRAA
jgi:16S rRNA (cytosine967-C5)-methyltransferase